MSQQEDERSVDDILESLGLDFKPPSPVESIYNSLIEGKVAKISTLRYWLKGEMERYKDLKERGFIIGKEVVRDGIKQLAHTNSVEYARESVHFYLRKFHMPFFYVANLGDTVQAISEVTDMLMKLSEIQDLAHLRWGHYGNKQP